MTASDRLFLRSLVAIACEHRGASQVDGEYIDGLLDAFGADDPEAAALYEWASTPRALEDIPTAALSTAERHTLLIHAAMLDWADRREIESEDVILTRLASHLSIPLDEARDVISRATGRLRHFGPPTVTGS